MQFYVPRLRIFSLDSLGLIKPQNHLLTSIDPQRPFNFNSSYGDYAVSEFQPVYYLFGYVILLLFLLTISRFKYYRKGTTAASLHQR